MNTSTNAIFFVILHHSCVSSSRGMYFFTAWFVLHSLLLPLFLLVLYIGFTKWRKQRNSATNSISHCDALTFHMTTQEVIMAFAAVMFTVGVYCRQLWASVIGQVLFSIATYGLACLHSLTCIERYLAVVRPITYLRLKTRGGVCIRNVSAAMSWLLSVVYLVVAAVLPSLTITMVMHFFLMGVLFVTITFCSISVLCALIGSRPGERGQNRKWIDQSKLSVFATIMVILAVLVVRLVQFVVMALWPYLKDVNPCVMTIGTFWFNLPSSMVLPLLFLHREGRLSACC